MSTSNFPARLDPYKFADQQKIIDATLDTEFFKRFRLELNSSKGEVHCKIQGKRDNDTRTTTLFFEFSGEVELICQGCMQPFMHRLDRIATIYPVYREEHMKNVPDDGEAVLVTEDGLDIKEAVEDELILSLPLVPLYGECEQLEAYEVGELPIEAIEEAEKENPFDALKNLKFKQD